MSEQTELIEQDVSRINLNFKVNKDLIVSEFNQNLDLFFDNEPIIVDDKTVVYLEKKDRAEIDFNLDSINTNFDIRVELRRKTILSEVSADAQIDLKFNTKYEIAKDWLVKTKTELQAHTWKSKPTLKVGSFRISSSGIANIILNRLKPRIESKIDESLQEILDFRYKLNALFRIINSPIRIDALINSEINVQLDEIGISSLGENNDDLNGQISLLTRLRLDPVGKDLEWSRYYIIPKGVIGTQETSELSRLFLPFNISYENLGDWLKEQYRGHRFEANENYFVVQDLSLSQEEDKIKLILEVTGTVNGTIELKGKPVYDIEKQELYSEGLETKLITNNIIHKAASWILKGKIHEELERISYFPLNKIIENLQAIIDKQLKSMLPKQKILGRINVESLIVKDFKLGAEEIHALLDLRFHMFTEVQDLNFFRKGT
ncbi:MAG: DUF4403 family protein [Bacteroidia bacterium]|nr:DUF4403 family protein [Bacteroidia bacterium]